VITKAIREILYQALEEAYHFDNFVKEPVTPIYVDIFLLMGFIYAPELSLGVYIIKYVVSKLRRV